MATNFLPNSTGLDLGSTGQRWDSFVQNEDISGNSTIAGNLTVGGTATLASIPTLTVTGNASIGGNETVTGTLAVTGVTTLTTLNAKIIEKSFYADQYASINLACDAAVAAGGGTVHCPPGSYTVAATVNVGGTVNHEPVELVLYPGTNISVTITNGTAAFKVYDGSAIRSRIGNASYQGFGGAVAAGRILCANNAVVSSIITNGVQTGVQQSVALENLWIGANSGTPTVTALVDMVGLASGTYFANLTIEQCANSIGFRYQPPAGGIASVSEFRNLVINALHLAGAQPVQIKNLAGNASGIGAFNFYSCDFEHAGAGLPHVEINGNGGTNANGAQAINFYGCYIEGSTDATQLGFKLTDAHDCSFYGLSFLGGGGTCIDINDSGAPVKTYNLNFNGIYNGNWATTINDHINTKTYTDVSLSQYTYLGNYRGLSGVVAFSNLTAQSAVINTATIYTTPATGLGLYRLTWSASVTTVGSVSSTLGGTNSFRVQYTDGNDSIVKTANPTTPAPISAGNTTGTTISGVQNCYAAASTAIKYSFDYTANAAASMLYDLTITVEYLGR